MNELVTQRMILRPFTLDDVAGYQQVMGQDAVGTHLPRRRGLTPDETAALLDTWRAHLAGHGFAPWCVTDRSDGHVLGHCGFRRIPETDEVELLYALGQENWGRGLASEAADAALGDAAERAVCTEVVAYATPDNAASHSVLIKCGFEQVGRSHLWGLDLYRFTRKMQSAASR